MTNLAQKPLAAWDKLKQSPLAALVVSDSGELRSLTPAIVRECRAVARQTVNFGATLHKSMTANGRPFFGGLRYP